MTTTSQPTNWRDVAEQLTPHQRAILADSEQALSRDVRPADWKQQVLVDRALDHIRRSAEDRERFGDVPAPAGAVHLWHFEPDEIHGGWHRAFIGAYKKCDRVTVWIFGEQRPDGSVRASVSVDTSEIAELDTAAARELAELLVLTAEEVDRINGDAPPF